MITVTFGTPADAYAAAAELKRLYTAETWGDIEISKIEDRAEMLLPPHSWRDGQLREIIRRFGGVQVG